MRFHFRFFLLAVLFFCAQVSFVQAAPGTYVDRWNTATDDEIYTLTWDGSYLWVSDTSTSPPRFNKYTASGATTTDSFSLTADNAAPSGITWDGTSFWVLDSVDQEVYRYNSDGVYQSKWSLSSSAGGSVSSAPRGIVWDGSFFWVTDFGLDEVYKYTSTSSYTGTSWDTAASGNTGPVNIVWDGTNFWVSDYSDLKVYQYNASGTHQGSWSTNSNNTGLRGLAANDTYFFATNPAAGTDYIYRYEATTTPPTITSVSSDKADGTYGVGEVIDIDITFSEAVTATTSVTVTLETGATDRTCTFTVSNSATTSCNYTVQEGDESADLNVSSISGAIEDQGGDALVNFTPTTNLAASKALVIETDAPTVSTFSPADNATDVAVDTNLVITFDQVVDAESGNITLNKSSDDSTIETFDVTSGVSGSGSTAITINPTSDLANGTEYYVQIAATAFDDTAGNSYAGISDTTTWSFTTVASTSTPEPDNTADVTTSGRLSLAKRIDRRIEQGQMDMANDLIKQELDSELTNGNNSLEKLNKLLLLLKKVYGELADAKQAEKAYAQNTDNENETERSSGNYFFGDEDLYLGNEGEAVEALQRFLLEQAVGPSAKELARVGITGYFGNYTKNALGEFQIYAGILPHSGYFGDITRSYINENY